MRTGKLSEAALIRSVLREIGHRRDDVVCGPAVGGDAAVLRTRDTENMVLATVPFAMPGVEMASVAVAGALNGVAVSGGEPCAVLTALMLPEDMEERRLKELIRRIEETAKGYGAEVIGGHTEVTPTVTVPHITVTGIGKQASGVVSGSFRAEPNQDLVVTKGIGIGAAAYLAKEKEQELLHTFSPDFIRGAALLSGQYLVAAEAETAIRHGAGAMHDVSRGGIFGALWEMAEGAGVGLHVSMKAIPIYQETVEICEFFGLNPYQILSTGSLLIADSDGPGLVRALEQKGIRAAVIGRTTEGKDRVIQNGEEIRYLDKPKTDELYQLFGR